MLGASIRRLKRNDKVRCLRDPSAGVGRITSVGTDSTIVYLGHNEWLTEYVTFANVDFGSGTKSIALKDLIKDERVSLYETLKPGDLVTFGKRKRARGLVLSVGPRRSRRPSVTDVQVTVLEAGVKKTLSVKQDVTIVQRI